MGRKIIQIQVVMNNALFDHHLLVYALCDDGSLWCRNPWHPNTNERFWDKVEDIPQTE